MSIMDMDFRLESGAFEELIEEAPNWTDDLASLVFAKNWDPLGISDVRVWWDDTPKQAGPAYESAMEEMEKESKKEVSGCALFGENDGSISTSFYGFGWIIDSDLEVLFILSPWDEFVPWKTTEGMIRNVISDIRRRKSKKLESDSGDLVGGNRIIFEDSVRSTLLRDLEAQPLLAKTYAVLSPNLINTDLPYCKRWRGVLSGTFRTLRNALKKVTHKQSRGPNIVSSGLSLFTSAIKLAVGMVVIGNTPMVGAVRAVAPEAAESGSLQAGDFEKSSNFWFGVVACVGTLVAIIALLKSFNWRRRHSIAGTSAAIAPPGPISNRAVNMAQTLVVRSWRETEYREVLMARREEEGAHHREGLGAGPN